MNKLEIRDMISNYILDIVNMQPELRFGQVLIGVVDNAVSKYGEDLFDISDRKLLETLEVIVRNMRETQKQRELKKLIENNPKLYQEFLQYVNERYGA